MTNFKKKWYGHCKECGKDLYVMGGLAIGVPIEFNIFNGKDKVCDECINKNPEKYKIKAEETINETNKEAD